MNEHTTHCTWLIRGIPRWVLEAYAESDGEFEWHPDSPSDLISECGAEVTELPNGWRCAAGHSHFNDAEYFDDEELAGMAADRLPLPANAHRMDGTPVF